MNIQLIEKVIKSDDPNACPELTYDNPLLDRKVAKALSRSFIKILQVSRQNTTINNNLRHSVLANIRRICRIQPENHLEIGDTVTNLLIGVYTKDKDSRGKSSVEKDLDEFLIRRMMETDVNSNYQSSLNPEVALSLINLNEKCIESISPNVLRLDVTRKKNRSFLKDLWMRPTSDGLPNNLISDLSIRMKTETEEILLGISKNLLTELGKDLSELFSNNLLKDLVQKCSLSAQCFQLCCSVLNCIFSSVNFSPEIQLFIEQFVQNVKAFTNSISVLYPTHLSHIVFVLDIDIHTMPDNIRSGYIHNTLPYLSKLHSQSESDLLLLLSHYSDWFEIYFEQ